MSTLTYNIKYGFLDGLCRAMFNHFLTDNDYHQLSQAETLDDLHVFLCNTGFGKYMSGDSKITPQSIYEGCLKRFVDMFEEMELQALDELKEFFVWLRVPYMIDNVLNVISSTHNEQDIDEVIERCHPLGMFDGIKSLKIASTSRDIYDWILRDTPLAPLFSKCVSTQELDDQGIEVIRLKLYAEYFSQFYDFCKRIGYGTEEFMSRMLEFQADCRAIIISKNSLGQGQVAIDDKESYYPKIGHLARVTDKLASKGLVDASLEEILQQFEEYKKLWDTYKGSTKALEDIFNERTASQCVEAFQLFFSFGVFYAWTTLMDQEVRNIQWICECIHQGKRGRANEYVRIRKS